jgi:putative membrane protein
MTSVKATSWIGFLVGLVVIILLIAWQGVAEILARLAIANWSILLIVVISLPQLILSTLSWQFLFASGRKTRFAKALLAMWIGTSVNTVLPVASVGGEVVRARLAMRWSVRGVDAVASVVSDKIVQGISTLLWAVVGVSILARIAPGEQLITTILAGLALLAVVAGVLLLARHAGVFGSLARFALKLAGREKWRSLTEGATDLVSAIRELFRRPGVILSSIGLRVGARVVMSGEVWLAAWLMGFPIGLEAAVLLKSLTSAARTVAFAVPGGLGAQEVTLVGVGALVGLSPDLMLAVSLAIRLRELVVGVPGLLAWVYVEGWTVWRRSPRPSSSLPVSKATKLDEKQT